MLKYVFLVCVLLFSLSVPGKEKINFNQDIRPILSDRCFHCHGPDEHERKKKLRLDISGGADGAYRVRKGKASIKPGSPDESEVWKRITTDDEDDVMPPSDSHKKALTDVEKALIKQWIEEGAEYKEFWAFVPPQMPSEPVLKNKNWSEGKIDSLILHSLEKKGLKPSKEADKRTLIRRLTFDLTGLPPTLEEIKEFVNDKSPDAWEKAIDRLMKKPQYGEHMAKYWLDLVRFADTNGMHKDFYRNFIYYRDWVIRSFNENLGYDDFLKYQLAGDLYENPTQDQLVASGFNRLHLIIDRGTALPEESYFKNVVDRVTSVGTVFMGMTMQCSMCHDHKYDPLTMKDFYSMFAFFNNLDGAPETAGRPANGLQPPFISFKTAEHDKKIAEFDAGINKLSKEIKQLTASSKTAEDKNKKQQLDKKRKGLESKRKSLQKKKSGFMRNIPGAMVMREKKEIRPSFMLDRGQYDKQGEKVERNTPAFLPPLKKKSSLASRMDLANWFVDSSNPLTARVAVNRFWQQFFGVGIVKTSEDLGAQGEVPSHPELLDYLAVSFTGSGWNIKALVKKIVMSKTYRQTSVASTENFKNDPENRLLARGSRFRMDSEMIRDQILHSSGLISFKMGGKSVKPPQPDGLWKAVSMTGERFRPDTGDDIYRRSVYTFWKRAMPPPQMTILNAPGREACIARRERTNTPLQALLLLNESEYMKAARNLAQKALALKSNTEDQKLVYIYETVTSKVPDSAEMKILKSMLEKLSGDYKANPKLAASMCEGIKLAGLPEQIRLSAWTMIVNTLFNLDVTKTRE